MQNNSRSECPTRYSTLKASISLWCTTKIVVCLAKYHNLWNINKPMFHKNLSDCSFKYGTMENSKWLSVPECTTSHGTLKASISLLWSQTKLNVCRGTRGLVLKNMSSIDIVYVTLLPGDL